MNLKFRPTGIGISPGLGSPHLAEVTDGIRIFLNIKHFSTKKIRKFRFFIKKFDTKLSNFRDPDVAP